MTAGALQLSNVAKDYEVRGRTLRALDRVDLGVSRGDFVCVVGASGSGKSTLMNILGCLDRPTSGRYWLDGSEISALPADARAVTRNRKIGFVFQSFNLLARTSALDNVMMPLTNTSKLSDAEGRRRAKELLERVGLGDRLDHYPSQLSGGQQQRVAIARALVNRPAIVWADEPTGNLDSDSAAELLALIRRLNEAGETFVVVTHAPEVAASARRLIRMRDGRIVADETSRQSAVGSRELIPGD